MAPRKQSRRARITSLGLRLAISESAGQNRLVAPVSATFLIARHVPSRRCAAG